MKVIIEDIHGNQIETDIVISEGDKLIVRATKACTTEELQAISKQMQRLFEKDVTNVLVIPHYIEFRVIKVTP